MSEKYEELNSKVKELGNENKDLYQRNEYYKRELLCAKEECKILQDAQDDLEQYTRRDCLEIRGILEITGENTNDIVKNVASNIGVDLEECDISVSHRLGMNQRKLSEPKVLST